MWWLWQEREKAEIAMMSFSHRVGGRVYNSPEGRQIQNQSPNPLLYSRLPSGSGKCWRLKMRKIVLSGLDLLEGSPWSMVLMEAMLSMVHAAAPGHDEAWDPWGHMQSVPLSDAFVVFSGFAVSEHHADLSGMCNQPPKVISRLMAHAPSEDHEWIRGPDTVQCCADVCDMGLLPLKAMLMSI